MSLSALWVILALSIPGGSLPGQTDQPQPESEEIVIATVSENPPALPRDLEPNDTTPPATEPQTTEPPTERAKPRPSTTAVGTAPPATAPPTTTAALAESPTTGAASTDSQSDAPAPTQPPVERSTTAPTEPTTIAIDDLVYDPPPAVLALTPGDDEWDRWYAALAVGVAAAMVGLVVLRSSTD